jgi:hypothetical protein
MIIVVSNSTLVKVIIHFSTQKSFLIYCSISIFCLFTRISGCRDTKQPQIFLVVKSRLILPFCEALWLPEGLLHFSCIPERRHLACICIGFPPSHPYDSRFYTSFLAETLSSQSFLQIQELISASHFPLYALWLTNYNSLQHHFHTSRITPFPPQGNRMILRLSFSVFI